ncbi:MAG: isochorismatase family protein [Alphaproteobacteria bacterium]|nr:isochorismatase family protein [Alphaproteobacteria bacterium]
MTDRPSLQDDAAFFAARGFGQKIGFGDRPALIVIDYMKAFTDDTMPLGANLDREIAETNRLIDAAHRHNIPVIFTVVAYDEDGFKDAGLWALKQKGVHTLKAGTDGVTLDPRVHREPRDIVLLKKYASSFYGTDLISRLNSRHIDTLIVTGCTTSGCVRATSVDAVQMGIRPIIAREAVGDRSRAAHEQSLFDLDQKYADVLSVDEIITHIDAHYAKQHNQPPRAR